MCTTEKNGEYNVYQELLDETTAQITIIDANTYRILYANKAALDKTKDMPGNYIGSVCYEFISHGDSPCSHCMIRTAEKGEYKSRMVEFGGRNYRQLYKIVDWNGCRAMMEYTEDVTEQVQNVVYAEQEKNLLGMILNNIPVGITVYKYENGAYALIEANNSIRYFLGISEQNLSHISYERMLACTLEEDKYLVKRAKEKLQEPGVTTYYEFRAKGHTEENYHWFSANAKSVLDPSGTVYIYIAYSDISQQKKARDIQTELDVTKKANESILEFYSRMSHDLRTPMNGILGLAGLSMEENDVSVLQDNMKRIRQSGKYLLSLINDTLDFQKIQSGKMVLDPKVVSTREIFNSIYNLIRSEAEQKGVEFRTTNLNADLDQYIRVDEVRLKQIFINLLSNAVKFTPAGGTVEMKFGLLKREGRISHDVFAITDTGIGMGEEFMQKGIFRPFQQDQNAITESTGTGLGLSIVKKLVEMMGGSISAESELGNGTTFTVYLNFERVEMDEVIQVLNVEGRQMDVSSRSLKDIRILLAEDHPLNAEIATKLLEKVGCRITWTKNGRECVSLFETSPQNTFDVILMDIRMPVMDGIHATKEIRQLQRDDARSIPIIAMTANAYVEDVEKSLAAGMNAHLAKPIETQVMYQTIAECLEHN